MLKYTNKSGGISPGGRLQAAMAKEEASSSSRRRRQRSIHHRSRKHGNVSNLVLSGKEPDNEGMYNRFSCFAVHSKMAQSTSTKSKPMEGLYTDIDPNNRSEIITNVTISVTFNERFIQYFKLMSQGPMFQLKVGMLD